MVAVKKEIMAAIGDIDFDDPFFIYLEDGILDDMKNSVLKGTSTPVTFYDPCGRVLFYSLVDIGDAYKDGLHVRLLIGNFGKYYEFIYSFFAGMTKFYGMKKLTFKTQRGFIKRFGLGFGFNLNEYGDYEKAVA